MDYLEIRELYHHGIKGQRWGIRRYQNDDGTLTDEGKKRYGLEKDVTVSGIKVKNPDYSKIKEGFNSKLYNKDRKEALDEAVKARKKLMKVAKIGKDEATKLINGQYGAITASDLNTKDKNSAIGKSIGIGAGVVAGTAATLFGSAFIYILTHGVEGTR